MLIDLSKVILILVLFVSSNVAAQGLEVLIKFQVNNGNFQETKITLSENGSAQTIAEPAKSKNIIRLDYDKDYVLAFEKPSYITKRIAISTKNVPDEIKAYDLGFDFAVEIFEQYEGVNTVIFNQPVARWFYDDQEDEFTYDTDYTKSIRSALVNFDKEYEKAQTAKSANDKKQETEEEARLEAEQKAAEDAKKLAEAKTAEEAKKKAEIEARLAEEAQVKAQEKERTKELAEVRQQEEKARLEEENRLAQLKAEQEKQKQLEVQQEEEKRTARAKEEEEKRAKAAEKEAKGSKKAEKERLDEEERARQKAELEAEMRAADEASKAEEKRRAEIEQLEIERRQREADARRAEKERLAAKRREEQERIRKEAAARAEEERKRSAASEAAFEAERQKKAKAAYELEQRVLAKAKAVSEAQARERSEAVAKMEEERKSLAVKDAGALLTRTEEEIKENNRTITQITIEREYMTYVYKKVVYNWGGIYYFRDDDSITKAVFQLESAKE